MSAVEVETGRPRPLSGGLWTLFSWLRREDHSSSDSLSSVGSDRTAVSFAFLQPGHYAAADPLVIPPPGPPTDSYKKRVRDRNVRRQHDRDITLLRKYGLHGFDAFSLPNARRAACERSERDRRAASELVQRRAHVPGKRRAPPPPGASSTLPRPRGRKRPAPQPPLLVPTILEKDEEDNSDTRLNHTATLPMNSQTKPDTERSKHNEVTMGCKPEKYSKKESVTKDLKPRQDKSFLKQIFENRKRNSAIETSTVKLLPSISELDKQAHEIIEKYKLKELQHNVFEEVRADSDTPGPSRQVEAWICTRCLRKYNATVITCLYCLPLENALLNNSSKTSRHNNISTQTVSTNKKNNVDDKEKLKEILKEMKDSIPKKAMAGPSHSKTNNLNDKQTKSEPKIVEAATLKIGTCINTDAKNTPCAEPSPPSQQVNLDKEIQNSEKEKRENLATIKNVLVTQPTVLEHTKKNIVIVDQQKVNISNQSVTGKAEKSNKHLTKTEIATKLLNGKVQSSIENTNTKSDINTPLKVSSLLNPIYIPKKSNEINHSKKQEAKKEIASNVTSQTKNSSALPSTSQATTDSLNASPPDKRKIHIENERGQTSSAKGNIVIVKQILQTPSPKISESSVQPATSQSTANTDTSIVEKLDQHSRRRNLINQLEQSIAKGDERAAAEAAVKLAQLRLSCSVLSFSSQIVAGAVSRASTPPEKSHIAAKPEQNENQAVKGAQRKYDSPVTTNKNSECQSNNIAIVEKRENVSQTSAQLVTAANKSTTEVNDTPRQKNAASNHDSAVNAPITSKDTNMKKASNDDVPILVWVEDKEATRGPVQIHVKRDARMGDLRRQAERSLGLAVRMQRWIIGRALCSDDDTLLVALAGPELSAPFYLCLVEAEIKEANETYANNAAGNVYNELVKLEQQSLVSNTEEFECGVCMVQCAPGNGIVLRECVHYFCKECLSDVVRYSEEPIVACPATGCRGVLQEREIKGLVTPEDYEKWLARGLAVAESGTRNAFHCRTRDCTGWALCEPGVRRFPCPVCKSTNCVPCQAIHEGESCDKHRMKLQAAAEVSEATNQADEGTRALLDSLIARGEALECPECSAIITKKWGCDWIKCSACKTEICWVTRGRRWGAAGRGDTSGGCRCGIDGKKCHPSCGYCH